MNPLKSPFKWVTSGLSGKTSWEWLELLIVPLGLAIGAFYLENRVENRQERIAAERYEQERNIADERVNQSVLDGYLEKMQGLLLDRNLRKSPEDSEVWIVARAITTTAMRELGSERNGLLINFLHESNLINANNLSTGGGRIESTNFLSQLKLSDANLSGVNLFNANLYGADLSGADLSGANLSGVNLNYASLIDINLQETYLSRSDLREADLSGADLRKANLGVDETDVLKIDIGYAPRQSSTNLSKADLRGADLRGADLRNADLRGADLRNADLREVVNVTQDQLSKAILCNTTIPANIDLDPNRDCPTSQPDTMPTE